MRAAMVGGAGYYAGKRMQRGQDAEADQNARLDDMEAQQYAAPAPAAPARTGLTEASMDELRKLAELKNDGILTEAEFEVQKEKLLHGL
jgi:hypothetical protein